VRRLFAFQAARVEEANAAARDDAAASDLEGEFKKCDSQDNTIVGRAWYLYIKSTMDRIQHTTEETYYGFF